MTSENKTLPTSTKQGLFICSIVEPKDELEERFEKGFQFLTGITKGLSEREANDALNTSICRGQQQHEDITLGLMYMILTDPQSAPRCYRDLMLLTRDGLTLVMTYLNRIVIEKYIKLQDLARAQGLWFFKEMVRNQVQGADTVCSALLRQIAGGDISPKNIWLAESMVDIFMEFRPWLEKYGMLVAMVVYTYLRIIVDHSNSKLAALRQREVELCSCLLREKILDCVAIGRDLIRLLQDVARIPEFEKLWKDILTNPTSLHSQFTGILQFMTTRTQRKFLISRLTPDMEAKMYFLLTKVRFGQQKRYQDWFQRQYLATPESQSLRCDLIRFICSVVHPPNEILCSDIIPRWAVIGWMLTTCTSNVAASNAKLALFYDWLFFDPEKDSIMNIEPAILVMHHSMRPHPAITATLLDFLCRILPNFYPPLSAQVRQGVYTSLRQILEKKVLSSLSPLFDNPKLDKDLKAMIRTSFGEFCSLEAAPKPDDLSQVASIEPTLPMPPVATPVVKVESDGESIPSAQDVVTAMPAMFSDDDEDDVPLGRYQVNVSGFINNGKLKRLVMKPPKPAVKEKVKEEVKPDVDITQYLEQLDPEIKNSVLQLQETSDSEQQCEVMDKLIEAVIKNDEFDVDMSPALATCLCHILNDQFSSQLLPDEADDEEEIEDSIGTSLFVIFRNLCQTPEEDPSRQAILMLMADMYSGQPRLGYYLLYFLKASKIGEDNMTHYKDFCKSLEGRDLSGCLLSDLQLCQEDDVRLFCYLVPDIYCQFSNIAVGNPELLNLIVSCVDGVQLQDLVCHIMQGNLIMFRKDSFLSVLSEWECRLREKQQGKSGPGVVQILYHLEQLRKTLKSTSFFSHYLVQHALQQVQLTCTESQKAKFSDLFSLMEDIDDIGVKPSSTRSLRGGARTTKPTTNLRSKAKSSERESESDTSDDEEIMKPKSKKRKKSMVGSDSD
ncbi:PREDICTED: integrator complex subunit 3-like [Priapulus caudatus]|uniref:SOSS complex subunit A homolog n=1 Tax=Priapulus caudatus TaxID=37621 RepID=A0ABM1EJ65_PRICU|nr:PREDICTED: integrator complex subunit 3-like [Priapulus caudatus]